MTFHCRFLLASAGFVMIMCAAGQSAKAQAESLTEAVVSALNHHPSVEAAIANRDAYGQERREHWAGYFPDVNVRAGGGRGYLDNATSRGLTVTRGAAYSWIWEGGVTMTQPLFDGFETKNRVGAAESRQTGAAHEISEIREGLALRAVMAYLNVMRGYEAVGKVRAHEGKLDDYIRRIDSMVAEGAAEESMAVQARDIKMQLQNTAVELQGQLDSAIANYEEVVGTAPGQTLAMPDISLLAVPDTAEEAIRRARADHPELQAAAMATRARDYDSRADRHAYFPSVDGELSYYKKDQAEEIGGELLDARAMVRLNWDISLAGAQRARVRQGEYRRAESQARQADTERRITREIRQAYSDLKTAQRRVNILKEREKINEELFRNYEAQFEGARVNLLQLLQTDNALFNARLALLNGQYRSAMARYAVLASMGVLQDSLSIAAAGNMAGNTAGNDVR